MAQQTTLSVEVAHFTQDEHNILHRGPTWLADKNRTTNTDSCQRAKSERRTHQYLNLTRAKRSVSTGSRFLCCQPQAFFPAFFSPFWSEPKSLNYSVVDPPLTLPSTALTVQKQTRRWRLSSCSTHKSPNHLFFTRDLTVNHLVSETTFLSSFFVPFWAVYESCVRFHKSASFVASRLIDENSFFKTVALNVAAPLLR